MHFPSTTLLQLIEQRDCHILYEKGPPAGRLKRDYISLKTEDGHGLAIRDLDRVDFPIELPPEMFSDYLAARFLEQDGPEDAEGRTIYRLTPKGRKAGRAG